MRTSPTNSRCNGSNGWWARWVGDVKRGEKNLFIKFDCWHARFLPLIGRAFPDVPWIFLYREPLEVLASHLSHRGAQMIPDLLEPALFGWDVPTVRAMALDEYGARALARMCEAALAQAQGGSGRLVNYCQLPGAVWPALMEYWGLEFLPHESRRMEDAAKRNAKNPFLPFEQDSEAKRQKTSQATRTIARQWLEDVYRKLEALRMERGFR